MNREHLPTVPQTMRAWPILILFAASCTAQPDTAYVYRTGSPDGIGKWYLGREIAHTMSAAAADWLDRPERGREERPERMLARLRIGPGDTLADIGCGTGFHALRMAEQAPEGLVYAVDIQPAMLDSVRERAAREGLTNVRPVQGTLRDPGLPAGAVDKVLLVDVYHELEFPREMMAAIVRALRPGGEVFLVEFRGEDDWVPIKPLHRMTREQCLKELAAAGLVYDRQWRGLPWQHLLVFRKP